MIRLTLRTHFVQPLGDAVLALLQQGLQLPFLIQELQTPRVRLQHRLHRWGVVCSHLWNSTETHAFWGGDE